MKVWEKCIKSTAKTLISLSGCANLNFAGHTHYFVGFILLRLTTIFCTDVDDCLSVQCQNGGTCIDALNNFTCECPANFTGTFCK